MANIKTKTACDTLAPRRNACFETLSKSRALDFRRGPDTWIARLNTVRSATTQGVQDNPECPAFDLDDVTLLRAISD